MKIWRVTEKTSVRATVNYEVRTNADREDECGARERYSQKILITKLRKILKGCLIIETKDVCRIEIRNVHTN
jgi:hypothetical protein